MHISAPGLWFYRATKLRSYALAYIIMHAIKTVYFERIMLVRPWSELPYVTNSLSRPHHHKGRIPQWAQESPSSPYIKRGNVLETCGDFFDQSYVEGSRRPWRSLHNCRRCWKCPHVWKDVENHGMWESSLESSMVVL